MKVCVFSEVTVNGKISIGNNCSSKSMIQNLKMDENKLIHDYRGKVDAIIIGRKTVTTDNPRLTNRYGMGKQPDRIVVSNKLAFSLSEDIFSQEAHTVVVTSIKNMNTSIVKKIEDMGHECVFVGNEQVDLCALFELLEREKGYKSVIVEGGGTIISELFENNLVDEIKILRMPIIINGKNVPEFVEYLGKDYCNRLKMVNHQVYNSFLMEEYVVQK